MNLIHRTPGDFKNETKWLKFFGNTQLLLLVIGAGITIFLYKILRLLLGTVGSVIGIIIGVLITGIIVIPSMVPVPMTLYLRGGGTSYSIIILRRIYRKRHQCIYIRGWGKEAVK